MEKNKHFETVTARSLAQSTYDIVMKTKAPKVNWQEDVKSAIESLIEPHIRKPSDDDKSVPARCEEAYNEASKMVEYAHKTITTHTVDEDEWCRKYYSFIQKSNPFKESDIVHDDEITDVPFEPNDDIEQFKARYEGIKEDYSKPNRRGITYSERIKSLIDDLLNAVEFYKEQNQEKLKPTKVPFSLELAAQGHKVVTRDGRSAKIVADGIDGSNIAVVVKGNINKSLHQYHIDGCYRRNGDDPLDLFILKEPETVNIWIGRNEATGKVIVNPESEPLNEYHGKPSETRYIKTVTVQL